MQLKKKKRRRRGKKKSPAHEESDQKNIDKFRGNIFVSNCMPLKMQN